MHIWEGFLAFPNSFDDVEYIRSEELYTTCNVVSSYPLSSKTLKLHIPPIFQLHPLSTDSATSCPSLVPLLIDVHTLRVG
jgi:hypothetical protein